MRRYVVGFAFWRNQVLLLHKKKGPDYVVGKLNGVGGKIEGAEPIIKAMSREFSEETGVETWPSAWNHVAVMYGNADEGNDYELNILYNYLPDVTDFSTIKNPEASGEELEWVDLDKRIGSVKLVDNLAWIIPLCIDRTTPFLKIYEG